jgi:GNAT superfamily N-acetyltransferase
MTTTVSHATSRYSARGTLANGLRVAVRPLLPGDSADIAAGFAHLSEESRYRRFLAGKPRLTGSDLRVLVDGADQHDHIGLVLVWPRRSRPDVVLGDAHAIRLRQAPDTADVAVTVADEIQGLGAGRLLMRALADAALEQGITRFTADMLASNTASHRMVRSVGAVLEDEQRSGLRHITVLLDQHAA